MNAGHPPLADAASVQPLGLTAIQSSTTQQARTTDVPRACGGEPAGAGRVRLELARPAMLDVKVVDRSGRVVAGVYRGNRPAGRSELPLDATRLTPGVYFLRAVANGEPLTVPFTVVR